MGVKRNGKLDTDELPGMKEARRNLAAEKRKPTDADRPHRERPRPPEQIPGQLDLLDRGRP